VIQLFLDLPPVGHRLGRARHEQRAGQQRLAELLQQRLHHGVVGDADADRALLGVHQAIRDVAGRGQDERVGTRCRRLDRPERRVAQVHELTELGEVAAHQGEVVLVVELAQLLDPLETVPVAQLDAQGVAGVGRVGDQRVVAEQVDHLGDSPWLRVDRVDVEVAGH